MPAVKRNLAMVVVLLLSSAPALAATGGTPVTLSHSGYLLDASDQPQSANVGMKFRVFDALSGGTLQWEGVCASVQVRNGYYAVLLGGSACVGSTANTPDPVLETSDLPAGAARFLEVEVAGITLSPRLVAATVPTAAQAKDSDALGGHPASDFAPSAHQHAGSDLTGASRPWRRAATGTTSPEGHRPSRRARTRTPSAR